MMAYTIAIDPSIRAMGYAVFHDTHCGRGMGGEVAAGGTFTLRKSGTMKQRKDLDEAKEDGKLNEWVSRARECASFVEELIVEYGPGVKIVIEMPSAYSGGKGDVASASGAVLKLGFLVGMIMGRAGTATLVPVRVWKGTTPKAITLRRVARMMGVGEDELDSRDHNEIDAIGIGRWYYLNELVGTWRYVARI